MNKLYQVIKIKTGFSENEKMAVSKLLKQKALLKKHYKAASFVKHNPLASFKPKELGARKSVNFQYIDSYNYHQSESMYLIHKHAKELRLELNAILKKENPQYQVTRKIHGKTFSGKGQTIKEAKDFVVMELSGYRKDLQRIEEIPVNKYVKGRAYTLIYDRLHGVHTVKNSILELYDAIKSVKIYESKKPSIYAKENYVGIELEFFFEGTEQALASALVKNGLEKYAHLKNDGSIRTNKAGQIGKELAILAKESEVFDVVEKITSVLKQFKAGVNQSCGMHVHLDARNRDHKKMFYSLTTHLNILMAMQPKSRQDNTYCAKNKTKHFDKERGNRYKAVNAAAFNKYNTIEVRLHSGTVCNEKISNWVKLLLTIVNSQVQTKRSVKLDTFFKTYEIDNQLRDYVKNRIHRFKGNVETDDELNDTQVQSVAIPF